MESHEVCNLFPEMSQDQFRSLSQDIAKHGQVDPIWTYKGQIVDGRNRYRVCLYLGIDPKFQEWSGECGSLLRFVASRNLHRRHLTTSQRAAIAAEIKPKIEEEIREELKKQAKESGRRGGRGNKKDEKKGSGKNAKTLSRENRNSRKEAAEVMNVSPRYVGDAEEVREKSPEAFDDVKAGRVTISQAKRSLGSKEANPEPEEEERIEDVQLVLSLDPEATAIALARHFRGEMMARLIARLMRLHLDAGGVDVGAFSIKAEEQTNGR